MAYSADLYVHDLDRQAADALNQFPKFVKLLESYSANYDEKAAKIDLLSTAIRLGENQMPEVYGLLPPICEQLGIDTPELYYVRDRQADAATFGSVHPCIYVTSGLVNKLPLNLLPSVLAHECGHIACKHSLYHSIAAQLIGGIDRSPLVRIPAIGKYLTPALVRALLFWDRCSELSADRAAALCDGTADKTIDVLLRLNGYGKNVDRKEFLKQALDLKSFVNDSKSNKLMELMLVQDETHPRLATRAYECYEWSQSAQYAGIVDGTFTLPDKTKEINQELAEEVVSAEAKVEAPSIDHLNTELARVNRDLEHYTNHADKATAAFGGGLQHHLRDFSHHPTPVGLVCSILTQFTGNVYGTDVAGAFQCVPLNKDGLNLVGKSFPEKITFGAVNWFFHMVSDVAGSSGSAMKGSFGTGLPGPLVSLLKEFSSTRLFKKQDAKGCKEFSVYISKLFNGTLLGERDSNGNLIPLKFDLRTEMGIAMQVGKQTIPVIINECIVRSFFLLRRLLQELSRDDIQDWSDVHKINWKAIIPFRNRTVDRMLTIASMTFTVADTADAAIHAAIESGGNWVLFSGRFVTRFNYVGAGRAALSIVREVSNEKKEAQLIHEKMILSEAKAALFLKQLQEFKEQLDLKVSNYLAEDIDGFMSGFADMQQGMLTGDSDLVIRGNVTIQKVLGREPQFTNQKEFDAMMESDAPLVL